MILDLSNGWRCVANFLPLPLYSRGHRPRCPLDRRLGESQIPSGLYGQQKNHFPLTGIKGRLLGHPDHSLVSVSIVVAMSVTRLLNNSRKAEWIFTKFGTGKLTSSCLYSYIANKSDNDKKHFRPKLTRISDAHLECN
jgi:hypothetical protein